MGGGLLCPLLAVGWAWAQHRTAEVPDAYRAYLRDAVAVAGIAIILWMWNVYHEQLLRREVAAVRARASVLLRQSRGTNPTSEREDRLRPECRRPATQLWYTQPQESEPGKARPAVFYVPAEASSVMFLPKEPGVTNQLMRGAAVVYELPQAASFTTWLEAFKGHLEALGWFRLTRNYDAFPEPVGDSAGWQDSGPGTPWMWKEAWANPGESGAMFIIIGTASRPSGPEAILEQGATVNMFYDVGPAVEQRLAEYVERFGAPWSTTQPAPRPGMEEQDGGNPEEKVTD